MFDDKKLKDKKYSYENTDEKSYQISLYSFNSIHSQVDFIDKLIRNWIKDYIDRKVFKGL